MGRVRTQLLLASLVALFLSTILLWACDDCKLPECTGGGGGDETPQTVTISGKVLVLTPDLSYPPLAGATVELEDGSIRATSGEDGSWTLEDVPVNPDEDPFIRITAQDYPTSFNSFPLSLGVVQYDLNIIDPALYRLLTLGQNPDTACLILGAVVGFVSYDYPQVVQPLSGATVTVSPDDLTLLYFNDSGFPDPNLTKTGSLGTFYVVVPDANAVTSVSFTGTRPGSQLIGPPSFPTRPGAFVLAGLIDLLYTP